MTTPRPLEDPSAHKVHYLWSRDQSPFIEDIDYVTPANDLAQILYRKRVSLKHTEKQGLVAFWKNGNEGTAGMVQICVVDRDGPGRAEDELEKILVEGFVSPAQRQYLSLAAPGDVQNINMTRLILIRQGIPDFEEIIHDGATPSMSKMTKDRASATGVEGEEVWGLSRLDKDTLSMVSYQSDRDPNFRAVTFEMAKTSQEGSGCWSQAQKFFNGEHFEREDGGAPAW